MRPLKWTARLSVVVLCGLAAGLVAGLAAAPARADALKVDTSRRSAVVEFYKSVYLDSNGIPAKWTGDASSCEPGKLSDDYKDAGIRRVNYYRAMAGLPGNMTLSGEWNAKCQAAALMMTANRRLSHTPASSWRCFTSEGAAAAGKSNLALGYESLPDAVDGWMRDVSTPTVGHRRWILYPPQELMGIGATFGAESSSAYALWVNRKPGLRPSVPWVAWPPKGFVPYQVVPGFWSFSYPGAGFGSAKVTMRHKGKRVPVTLQRVENGYGDNTLVWKPKDLAFGVPSGVPSEAPVAAPVADKTYSVEISGVSIDGAKKTFSYEVTVVDPEAEEE